MSHQGSSHFGPGGGPHLRDRSAALADDGSLRQDKGNGRVGPGHGRSDGPDAATGQRRPALGMVEWFRVGEHERVEQVLQQLRDLKVGRLRTGLSWADWHTKAGKEWYAWLLPRLARQVELLPCVLYTPPSLGLRPRTSSPPRDPKAYADFIDLIITRFGDCFEYLELWNEPNNVAEWDWTLDKQWLLFARMVGGAAYWTHQRGKRTVLGGMSPVDPNWLELMFVRKVMKHIDVVGIHGFPGTFESNWDSWAIQVEKVRQVLRARGSEAEIWITETGYSTRRHDEQRQVQSFLSALRAPAERLYWYAVHDLHADEPAVTRFHEDEREYHFGIRRHSGEPKLLARVWQHSGVEGLEELTRLTRVAAHAPQPQGQTTVITGGAGFIGTNLADRLLREGGRVLLLDNLSRPGVEQHARWLRKQHGSLVRLEIGDIRDRFIVRDAVRSADSVFHLAAQVAVTTSLVQPLEDLEINTLGTTNLLEELRALDEPPPLVFTSTNKVYGSLPDVPLVRRGSRWEPEDERLAGAGLNEQRPLDFHSPYGCSKGAADQYVLDYARSYDLPTVVFRMSCIYGPHQLGTEDQGWVAHFLISARQGQPITIYGDGHQVRDLLFVEDLVDAMLLARQRIDSVRGRAFNIGGGRRNTASLLELVDLLEDLQGTRPELRFAEPRTGDQRWYVSDTSSFQRATGWHPQVDVRSGVARLYSWLGRSEDRPNFPLPAPQTDQVLT